MKKIIYLAAACILFAACEPDIRKVNIVTATENLPVETASDVELLYSDSAVLKVKLIAPRLDRYAGKNPYLELTEGVKVWFYDSLQKPHSTLTANYAIRKINEQVMEARNDVIVVNKKGERLNTEHLIWDENEAKIFTEDFVRITTEDEVILGKGMEADQYFDNYKIFNIQGTIKVKDEEAEGDAAEKGRENI